MNTSELVALNNPSEMPLCGSSPSARISRGVCQRHIVSSLAYHESKLSRFRSLDTIRFAKLATLAKNL